MKRILPLILMLFLLQPVSSATASWLINLDRFAASVHRDISCGDCHSEVLAADLHPDPAMVNRSLADFFSADSCYGCHDNVEQELAQGTHGALKVKSPEKFANCIVCHNPHYQRRKGEYGTKTPPAEASFLSEEDRNCMGCHGLPPDADARALAPFCFQCHAAAGTPVQAAAARIVPMIKPDDYRNVAHAEIACLACHPKAAAFHHDRQPRPDCLQCHARHDAGVARDVHMEVSCPACHSQGVAARRDPPAGLVVAQIQAAPGTVLSIHEMDAARSADACRRCHRPDNRIGAAALLLPAKGFICMPCHVSTFSAGGAVGWIALLIFAGGMLSTAALVLSGSMAGLKSGGALRKVPELAKRTAAALFSGKIRIILKALLLDVLLQRRLYRKSPARWLIHSLIFLSFAFRFLWGLAALLLSLSVPQWSWIWFMLNRNSPTVAFLFDLSGILILAGVTAAFIRGARTREEQPPDLPPQDRLALGLIAAMVLAGFALEGIRIAMTGAPPGSGYAFAGYGLSRLLSSPAGMTGIYGTIWYLHAVLTGAFIAYLPFSRLLHIIMAPLVLAMAALAEAEHKHRGAA